MIDIKTSWASFKAIVDTYDSTISYVDKNGNYYLFTIHESNNLTCILDKSSEDAEDFEDNYLTNSTLILAGD